MTEEYIGIEEQILNFLKNGSAPLSIIWNAKGKNFTKYEMYKLLCDMEERNLLRGSNKEYLQITNIYDKRKYEQALDITNWELKKCNK